MMFLIIQEIKPGSCTAEDFKNLEKLYQEETHKLEHGICRHFHYYSTKCTISEQEIKNGTSEEEKNKLITLIPMPSQNCQDATNKESKSCSEKVALESGYNRGDLKNKETYHKIDCCLKYKIIDCMLKLAKVLFNLSKLKCFKTIFQF